MDGNAVGLSVHHALGGHALWLVVSGVRNSTEVQSAATLAGHRLKRVLGGFSGHLVLDSQWCGYYVRTNEVALVTLYASSTGQEPVEPQRAAETSRAALLELCGGRLSDVTLATLNRLGSAVQLCLRKAMNGWGRLPGAGSTRFDLTSVMIGPDVPLETPALRTLRAANDIVATNGGSQSMDAFLVAQNKGGQFGESIRTLRPPNYFDASYGSAGAEGGTASAPASKTTNGLAVPAALSDSLKISFGQSVFREKDAAHISHIPAVAYMDACAPKICLLPGSNFLAALRSSTSSPPSSTPSSSSSSSSSSLSISNSSSSGTTTTAVNKKQYSYKLDGGRSNSVVGKAPAAASTTSAANKQYLRRTRPRDPNTGRPWAPAEEQEDSDGDQEGGALHFYVDEDDEGGERQMRHEEIKEAKKRPTEMAVATSASAAQHLDSSIKVREDAASFAAPNRKSADVPSSSSSIGPSSGLGISQFGSAASSSSSSVAEKKEHAQLSSSAGGSRNDFSASFSTSVALPPSSSSSSLNASSIASSSGSAIDKGTSWAAFDSSSAGISKTVISSNQQSGSTVVLASNAEFDFSALAAATKPASASSTTTTATTSSSIAVETAEFDFAALSVSPNSASSGGGAAASKHSTPQVVPPPSSVDFDFNISTAAASKGDSAVSKAAYHGEEEDDEEPSSIEASVSSAKPLPTTNAQSLSASITPAAPSQVSLKLEIAETILLAGKSGGTSSADVVTVMGSIQIQCARAVSASASSRHSVPTEGSMKKTEKKSVTLRFITPARISELSFVESAASTATTPLPFTDSEDTSSTTATSGSHRWLTVCVIPLTLNPPVGGEDSDSAESSASPQYEDAGKLVYTLLPSFQPTLIKVKGTGTPKMGPVLDPSSTTPAPTHQQRAIDVLLKVLPVLPMEQAMPLAGLPPTSSPQFLLQLPLPLPPHSPSDALLGPSPFHFEATPGREAAYTEQVHWKPKGDFNPQKAQIRWLLLTEDAPLATKQKEELAPRASSYLCTGKLAEYKARIIVNHGITWTPPSLTPTTDLGDIMNLAGVPLPLQYRCTFAHMAHFAPLFQVPPLTDAREAASKAHLADMSNGHEEFAVADLTAHYSSSFRATWK